MFSHMKPPFCQLHASYNFIHPEVRNCEFWSSLCIPGTSLKFGHSWDFGCAELLPKTKCFLTSVLLYIFKKTSLRYLTSVAIWIPWCTTNSLRGCPTMSTGWLSCRFVVLKSKLNCYHGNKTQKKLSSLENKNCLKFSFKGFILNIKILCIIYFL